MYDYVFDVVFDNGFNDIYIISAPDDNTAIEILYEQSEVIADGAEMIGFTLIEVG